MKGCLGLRSVCNVVNFIPKPWARVPPCATVTTSGSEEVFKPLDRSCCSASSVSIGWRSELCSLAGKLPPTHRTLHKRSSNIPGPRIALFGSSSLRRLREWELLLSRRHRGGCYNTILGGSFKGFLKGVYKRSDIGPK